MKSGVRMRTSRKRKKGYYKTEIVTKCQEYVDLDNLNKFMFQLHMQGVQLSWVRVAADVLDELDWRGLGLLVSIRPLVWGKVGSPVCWVMYSAHAERWLRVCLVRASTGLCPSMDLAVV